MTTAAILMCRLLILLFLRAAASQHCQQHDYQGDARASGKFDGLETIQDKSG
ncbi:MAG TPA: hypothetical protein VK658_23890 [Chryseolinea sp.]|nr:hypothetical protein [Chryseolinea sp.]